MAHDAAADHATARRPGQKRRLALTALLAAAALAVIAYPFRDRWWGGLVLAIAEAGVVGGLADWFAVTALFRHPLGIPIPHTALIPANWQLMAARVGSMVGGRILTAEYVTQEISRVDVAALLARAARRIKPADLEPLVAAVARWAVAQVPSGSATEMVSFVRGLLLRRPMAPLLAEIADVAHRNEWDQRLVQALARTLAETLDRPHVRAAVAELVDEVIGGYRRRMGGYPGFLIKAASVLGLIDTGRLVSALRSALAKVAEDPDDPLCQRIREALGELPDRLRTDPGLAARVEATKTELLTSPAVSELIEDAAAGLSRALATDLEGPHSELISWITSQIERARETLVSDEAVRRYLDRWIKQHAITFVDRYQNHLAAFIERGVHALGAEGAVRLIEQHVGDDLQYIRVNGTVVGGLAGGAIYGLHFLLNAL